MQARQIPHFRRRLLKWYDRHKRDLPWRRRPTLYRTLVAEFMLQQTRADQVIPYYRRFLRAFPSARRLAAAPLSEVVRLWEGLGYYRRAGQLWTTVRNLQGRRNLQIVDLQECPGIGPYTLAAVGSIVLGQVTPVVDGNVRRVVTRILALPAAPESREGREQIERTVTAWIAPDDPGTWNQALMELGAVVCTPRQPDCARCPGRSWCRAYTRGEVAAYPVRPPRKTRPHRQIAAAIIRRADGRILIAQRLATGLLPNLWEFPGGKQERGETLKACCAREIREELAIDIAVGRKVLSVDHAYSHYAITLHAFECRYLRGRPKAIGCQAWQWVHSCELVHYPFPRANHPLVALLTRAPTVD